MQPPSGHLTFLFTDIEGSSQLWEQHPQAMGRALARHDALLRGIFEEYGGYVFKTIGDAFCVAFPDAAQALRAALAVQRGLAAEAWEETGPIKVRVALHSGEAEERDGDYFGQSLNRLARLLAAAHGGQTLLSRVTTERVREHLPRDVSLRDLGERRLKDLSRPERIFQLMAPELPEEFPPLRSLEVLPTNLPAQVTSFVGRSREMAEIKRALGSTRLLTLTGPGGTGKTRLALQVGAELLETFPHGVWLVELATLSDPDLIPDTVSLALGLREEPGRPIRATLLDSLRTRRMLIILDNCEHLVAGCAELAAEILRFCPDQQILATSREALNIPGEVTWMVPSLQAVRISNGETLTMEEIAALESVQLFVDRAVAVRPDFVLTRQNAEAVAEVCWRCDGIPLAIELAAARVKVLTPAQILARVDDRFRLLTGGSRTALPRQQTLSALIDWSYDLLNEKERALLQRLSVFVAGRTLEMAERVCTDDLIQDWEVLDLLGSLVDKSLLSVEPDESGESRYVMIESVWDYAWDKLVQAGDSERFRERHLDYFLRFAESSEEKLRGPEQAEWLERFETELYNFRFALEGTLEAPGRIERGLRLAAAIVRFWEVRSYFKEAREHFEALLSRGGEVIPPHVRAKALAGAARIAWCEDENQKAMRCFGEALEIYDRSGDHHEADLVRCFLGFAARNEGQLELAREQFDLALASGRERDDREVLSTALSGLGTIAAETGDLAKGREHKTAALQMVRQLGDRWVVGLVVWSLGKIVVAQGDHAMAQACFKEAVEIAEELGNRWAIPYALEGFADAALLQNNAVRATQLYGAASRLRELVGLAFSPAEKTVYDATLSRLREMLPEAVHRTQWEAGRALRQEEALALALRG